MSVKISLETTQANFEHLHKQAESTSFKLEEPAKVKARERRP